MSVEVYQFPERFCTTDVTIAKNAATSSATDLRGTRLIGVAFPAHMQGPTVDVQASVDGSTYTSIYDRNGAQLQVYTTASTYVFLRPDEEVRVGWVRLAAATTQTASRTITLVSTI